MTVCRGLGDSHCCWIAGQVCQFLEENTVPGRRWACGLRRELGSWPAVHADQRYREHVKPRLAAVPSLSSIDCGDWPTPGVTCGECGVTG